MKKALLYSILLLIVTSACKNKTKSDTLLDSDPNFNVDKNVTAPTLAKNSEESSILITPISHATAVITYKDLTIYIDPVGGIDAFKGQNTPDLILITDVHGDHLSIETLLEVATKNTKLIVPKAVEAKIPEFTSQTVVITNGEIKSIKGITVEAIPMYNLRPEALKFHEKGRGNGYVLTISGKRIYFSGDTEDIPEMRALKNIDKAFICMNLPYTMTEESAANAVLEFKPKQVYPYHYRGKPDVSDVVLFKKLVNEKDSKIEVIQLDWYPEEDY